MITDLEKKEIFKNIVFNKALYYESHTHKDRQLEEIISLTNDFENESDFIIAVKKVIAFNNGTFLVDLQYFNRSELREYYQIQFDLYKEKAPTNCLNWLNRTKKRIANSKDMYSEEVDDTIIRGVFTNWYNETIKKIQPQQMKTSNPDEVLIQNEYIDIFKNDFGFTLFTKMFNLYKDENKHLANFSFLFFAMENDFLVCSQVNFVKFLENENYNINIEKIDNRQFKWQISKKAKLYNSIKESLQIKHVKSTN